MTVNADQTEKEAYLRQISRLSFKNARWNRKSITEMRDFLGPWDHNIKLSHRVFTANCEDYYPAHQEIMKIINQQLGGNFRRKRAASGKAVGEVQDAELDMLLDRQVRPLHRLTRAVLPQMLARRKGKIVVVGSATGLRGQPRRADDQGIFVRNLGPGI